MNELIGTIHNFVNASEAIASARTRLDEAITDCLKDILPHGSGIDCDWSIRVLRPIDGSPLRVMCKNSYHAMDEYGGYCHWQDFSAIIYCTWDENGTPTFDLHRLAFNGRLHACAYGLRDYLEEVIVLSFVR